MQCIVKSKYEMRNNETILFKSFLTKFKLFYMVEGIFVLRVIGFSCEKRIGILNELLLRLVQF